MKLKVEVLDAGNGKASVSAWGSTTGNVTLPLTVGSSIEIEGDTVSLTGSDPVPAPTDAGLG